MREILNFVDGLMEQSSPQSPAWNVEHKLEAWQPKWNYIDGCMLKAIFDLYYAAHNNNAAKQQKYFDCFAKGSYPALQGDKKGMNPETNTLPKQHTPSLQGGYVDFAKSFVDFFVNDIEKTGCIVGYSPQEYNCDNINMGKVLFDLYALAKEKKYRLAIELLQSQLEKQPRINAGNFWHKNIYPNQVWLDGLYMVQPFYLAYELTFNNGKNVPDSLRQFQNVYEIMRDPKTGLLYHGYDESREMFWADPKTGLSKNFWSRSIGWFCMALVDSAEILLNLSQNKNKTTEFYREKENFEAAALCPSVSSVVNQLKNILQNVINALFAVQDKDSKMFWQVTDAKDRPGNYLETSGTCAIAYSLMKGARLGILPGEYFCSGKEIFDAVVKNKLVLDNGAFVLKDICLVAGLGGMPGKGNYKVRDGTFEYYVSEPKVNNDAKGVAPFLFSYAECIRGGQK